MEDHEFTSFLKSNLIWFLRCNGKNKILKNGTVTKVIIPCGNRKKELFLKISKYINTLYNDIEVLYDYNNSQELINNSIHQDIHTDYFDESKKAMKSSIYRVYYM